MTLGIRGGETLSDGRELALCIVQRCVRSATAEDLDARRPAPLVLGWIQPQRYPDTVVDRKREAFRHDTDDGVSGVAELNGLPDDVRVGGESRLPEVVAD